MISSSTTWFRVYAGWVSLVYGLAAIACFIDEPEWFSAHSLAVFNDLTGIPWPVVGVAFLAVPGMMLTSWTRLYAWALAFVLSVAAVATLWIFTIIDHQIINVIISLLALNVPLTMLTGVRYCVLVEKTGRKTPSR